MEGLGQRLHAKSVEKGWSDSEVARRASLAQTRYANYVADRHEPDLATFVRICAVLGASVSEMLAPASGDDEASRLRGRVISAMAAMDLESIRVLAVVSDGLVARATSVGGAQESSAVVSRPEA